MRRYRSYKFTNKKHSKGGVRSSIAGALSLICTVAGVFAAFVSKGNAGSYLALLGTVAIVASFYGVYVGNQSFKEEECYYLFSRIGTIVNFILAIFWIAVVGIGALI